MSVSAREKREQRTNLWNQMKAMLDAAEAQGRGLDAGERSKWQGMEKDLDTLKDEILFEEAAEARKLEMERPETPGAFTAGASRTTSRDLASAVTLGREERMSDWLAARDHLPTAASGLSFTKFMKGVATGHWEGADEERALSEGTGSAGGFLVPAPLSANIIDRARNQARVLQAGARTVPMESQTLKIARVAGDATASWHSENAAITDSDMTLESVTLTAQTLTSLTRASRELLEDSEVEDTLEAAFAAQLALSLDKAALYGSGTPPEPRGVKNTSGVTLQSMGANGAVLANFDPFIDALGTLWSNNEDVTAVIHAPRTEKSLAKLKDSNLSYLEPPQVLQEVPRYATNQVPVNLTQGTATDASDSFVADWGQLLIGVRSEFRVEVLTERFADNFQYGFLSHLRADIVVARPKAFVVIVGITP